MAAAREAGSNGSASAPGDAVVDDVHQPTGGIGHHGGGADVGFDAGVGEVVLAGGDHEDIGGGSEQAQAEVVVQAAAGVDREAQIRRGR
jgi:hypothetical protein